MKSSAPPPGVSLGPAPPGAQGPAPEEQTGRGRGPPAAFWDLSFPALLSGPGHSSESCASRCRIPAGGERRLSGCWRRPQSGIRRWGCGSSARDVLGQDPKAWRGCSGRTRDLAGCSPRPHVCSSAVTAAASPRSSCGHLRRPLVRPRLGKAVDLAWLSSGLGRPGSFMIAFSTLVTGFVPEVSRGC